MQSGTTNPMGELIQHLRGALLPPEGADLTDSQLLDLFDQCRDPAVLEVLVRRYGPMAWNACARVLRDRQDTEDAFQATFLVLVRKAASLRERTKVGNWLYGVAHQTACRGHAQHRYGRRPCDRRCVVNSQGWTSFTSLASASELAGIPGSICRRNCLLLID